MPSKAGCLYRLGVSIAWIHILAGCGAVLGAELCCARMEVRLCTGAHCWVLNGAAANFAAANFACAWRASDGAGLILASANTRKSPGLAWFAIALSVVIEPSTSGRPWLHSRGCHSARSSTHNACRGPGLALAVTVDKLERV